jgi:hypothetical protein
MTAVACAATTWTSLYTSAAHRLQCEKAMHLQKGSLEAEPRPQVTYACIAQHASMLGTWVTGPTTACSSGPRVTYLLYEPQKHRYALT